MALAATATPVPPTTLAASAHNVAFLTERRTGVVVAPLPTTAVAAATSAAAEFEVEGHRGRVTAVALAPSAVASASPDALLLTDFGGRSLACAVLAESPGDVAFLAFLAPPSPSLVACVGHEVRVYDTRQRRLVAALGPHRAAAVCCDGDKAARTVCVCCEDGALCVWDAPSATLLAETVLAPGVPLRSVAAGALLHGGATLPLVVGADDGRAFVIEVRDNAVHVVHTVPAPKAAASPVIAVHCASQPKTETAAAGFLLASTEGVRAVAAGSWAVSELLAFGRLAGGCVLCADTLNPGKVLCAMGSAFEPVLEVFRLSPPWTEEAAAAAPTINVFTSLPPTGSALLVRLSKPVSAPSAPASRGRGKPKEQPVMFHAKVRSSGYGTPPETRRMFTPKINKPKATTASAAAAKKPKADPVYPRGSAAPSRPVQSEVEHGKLHGGAITGVCFGGRHGKLLLTCSSDTHARASKLPLSKHKGLGALVFSHSSAVTSIDGSADGCNALTASTDQTVKLWALKDPTPRTPSIVQVLKGSPALEISTLKGNSGKDSGNSPFTNQIMQASFFFKDRIVLVAYGSTLIAYTTLIDIETTDAQRLQNRSKAKAVLQVAEESKIMCFACNNSAASSIAIAATSDHAISVHDLATATLLHRVQGAHDRPIHHVALIKGGIGADIPEPSHNLFVSSASDNCVKLWDLRTVSCVRKFEGHTNRQHRIGSAISPCSRFVASGSEDMAVCVWDIGMGSLLSKLRGHTDVVSDVSWNTAMPTLASGSHDGTVRFFVP